MDPISFTVSKDGYQTQVVTLQPTVAPPTPTDPVTISGPLPPSGPAYTWHAGIKFVPATQHDMKNWNALGGSAGGAFLQMAYLSFGNTMRNTILASGKMGNAESAQVTQVFRDGNVAAAPAGYPVIFGGGMGWDPTKPAFMTVTWAMTIDGVRNTVNVQMPFPDNTATT